MILEISVPLEYLQPATFPDLIGGHITGPIPVSIFGYSEDTSSLPQVSLHLLQLISRIWKWQRFVEMELRWLGMDVWFINSRPNRSLWNSWARK